MKAYVFTFLVLLLTLLIFSPSFKTGFSQDDYKNLYLSQNINQVFSSFNIFQKAEYPFFRPISTQLYFYILRQLFGLKPFFYHIFNFIMFAVNILLVNKLIILLTKSQKAGIFGIIFFAVNTTHFAPMNSPAYVQELFFVCFSVLSIIFLLKKQKKKEIVFFILALMSKETGVILPFVYLLIDIVLQKTQFFRSVKSHLTIFIILLIYLFGHIFFYGVPKSSSYVFQFGKSNILSLMWYFLWALSTPNILIDFLLPGFKMNKVFFVIGGYQAFLAIIGICVLLFCLVPFFLFALRNNNLKKLTFCCSLWFAMGVLPLIIFPLHKLAVEQSFSLVAFAIWSGAVLGKIWDNNFVNKFLIALFMLFYTAFAINSVSLAYKTHWTVRSAAQAKNVFSYLFHKYPNLKKGQVLYFKNGVVKIPEYGSSRQIYLATGEGKGFEVVYGYKFKLFFEEINPLPKNQKNKAIIINSSKLLGY